MSEQQRAVLASAERHAQRDFTRTHEEYATAVHRATQVMKERSAAIYRAEVERHGLAGACRIFLHRDLGGPGAEITPETLRWLHEWEEIVRATVTLLPGWRFTVEQKEGGEE